MGGMCGFIDATPPDGSRKIGTGVIDRDDIDSFWRQRHNCGLKKPTGHCLELGLRQELSVVLSIARQCPDQIAIFTTAFQ